jgi:hypothetical protein
MVWYKMKGKIILGFAFVFIALAVGFASAATVCCEKTTSGLYCQDAPSEQCSKDANPLTGKAYLQSPTSCRSTSYCKPGICYDSNEGTCLDNTPQNVCNANNGIWTDKAAPQCELGCCVLGDQAAFVTLVRCKKLSASLGLQTNYKKDVTSEVLCIASVFGQQKGACVYTFEFQKTCRQTTREDCTGKNLAEVNATSVGEFFPGKLCSAEELGTICGPTTKTMCVPGKEEVYFTDSCGNPANVYDASKYNDKNYWTDIKDKTESCNPNAANANSPSCGNCNYIAGSFCRATSAGTAKATYGTNICADLNCHRTQNGKSYKHGESWCVYNDAGKIGESNSAVGSAFFKHICINGEEVLEACADFRQHECIEDSISTTAGPFSQAACRVNRWQDCVAQTDEDDCENTDKRDCAWKGYDDSFDSLSDIKIEYQGAQIACFPKNPPGLKFWEGDEAATICAQADTECEVTYELGLVSDKSKTDGTCVKNCHCRDGSWADKLNEQCRALGDCGTKQNWVGTYGEDGSGDKKVKVDD